VRPLVTLAVAVLAWEAVAWAGVVPAFLLPDPWSVARALWRMRGVLAENALMTLAETVRGAAAALVVVFSPFARRWLTPLLVVSQAIPVFALAPLLVLWFGFGIASKVVMAVLVIFFPVMAAFADGLRRADGGWVDLARTMGASRRAILLHVRLPAALPQFGAGLRIATAIAPIGAVVGEWVGAAGGLGYVMLNANARLQTDVMFAALVVLAAMAVGLWVLVDRLLRRLLHWAPETDGVAR
jgi:putative hydroxymethylpyrimidine transport system permease protein